MARTFPPTRAVTAALLLATALGASACSRQAGDQIVTSDFGNATMNNHLVQTCQAGPDTAQGKYVSSVGGCPGRTLDGKYARNSYGEYLNDAAPVPNIARPIFRGVGN